MPTYTSDGAGDADNRLLAELSYIAAGYGLIGQVDAICGALAELRPDSVMPAVIRADARMTLQRYDDAERVLRDEALAREPANTMAKAHLGLVLRLQGRSSEGGRLLREVADSADDADAVALAQRALHGS